MNRCSENNVLNELMELLKLEKVEGNTFRGQSQDVGFKNVFGGQVLGQALSAAYQTVPETRRAHSLHAYFLRHGDANKPIVYEVDCIRDGKSFTTRRVRAVQYGREIFSMAASFQVEESGFEHQDTAPEVVGPEGLESELERAQKMADRIPENVRDRILCEKPIEIRPVNPVDPFAPEERKPDKYNWFKAISRMPDDPAAHQYLLAYASDFYIVGTSLYPHGHVFWGQGMQTATLDHAMWFHRPVRMDDWLLYVMHSPNASGARGLTFGKVYSRDGKLVATIAQEGLIRYRGEQTDKKLL